ncbi:MAG: M56 family metallopeptidase [Nocardioides sp.]|uniref:M56 family metallopeptidase n=1 Tax=Nocardioides sp. TaxID=35761 RepID=UPI0039E5E570
MTGPPITIGLTALLVAMALMVGAPSLLLRRHWTARFPRIALTAWLIALLSGALAILVGLGCAIAAVSALSAPRYRALTLDHALSGVGVTLAAFVLTSIAGAAGCAVLYRGVVGMTLRHRLRTALVPVGRRTTPVLVDSPQAGAVSLPGRRPVILVSARLQHELSPDELEAVVEHERGHLRQHHHLIRQIADLQYHCLPGLPCARALERSVPLLIELAADDHAAQRCGPGTVATALRTLARTNDDPAMTLRAERLERRLSPRG